MKSPVLLTALILMGCAHRNQQEIVTIYDNKWFSANKEHSIEGPDSKPVPHLFFDVSPDFVSSNRSANVIITTPYRSPHAYGMDLPSGQRYFIHSYCEQKDVWKKQGGTYSRPDFSIGYLPRVLDQLGDPHKVIVFGDVKRERGLLDTNHARVRMVGAYVEQICMEGNCVGKNTWLSRLVFVAVDADDRSFDHIASLKAFKREVKWDKIKTQLENMDGRNPIGQFVSPAIRVRPLIGFSEAFSYFKKRSIYFTPKELVKVQSSCHMLYEKFWTDVGEIRPEDRRTTSKDEFAAKLRLREEIRLQKKPVGFAARLRIFVKKYFNEMKTCEKFVYHGNINQNPDKFWFLSYMGFFFRLHQDGYYYDCGRNIWEKNYLTEDAKPYYDLVSGIDGCSDKNMDLAVKSMAELVRSENLNQTRKFRFVDYDTHAFGSHRKLYSWTKFKLGKFECFDDPNGVIQSKLRYAPEDTPWIDREVKDRTLLDSKIIY